MNSNKPFSECEPIDSFWLNLNYTGANAKVLPAYDLFTIPILREKQIRFFVVKDVNGCQSSAGSPFAGVIVIKCSALASSDKILCTLSFAGSTTFNQNIGLVPNKIIEVLSPLGGQLNLEFTPLAVANTTFTGVISIGIDCYA